MEQFQIKSELAEMLRKKEMIPKLKSSQFGKRRKNCVKGGSLIRSVNKDINYLKIS